MPICDTAKYRGSAPPPPELVSMKHYTKLLFARLDACVRNQMYEESLELLVSSAAQGLPERPGMGDLCGNCVTASSLGPVRCRVQAVLGPIRSFDCKIPAALAAKAFCKSLLQAHEARGEDIHVLTHIKDQACLALPRTCPPSTFRSFA